VLEELQNRTDLTQLEKEIAKKVGCCEVYVSQIKKAKMMDAQPTWYEKHMSRAKEFDPSRLVLDRPIACTSNLYPDVPLRDITEKERSEHMLNISTDPKAAKSTRNSLRRALFQGARKEDFHGFVEVEQTMSEEDSKAYAAILHSKLPTLLARKKHGAAAAYEACFAPIFEYAQLAPLGPGEVRGDAETEDDRRMGDKKRSQAKLSALLETAAERVKQAQADVDKCTCKTTKKRRSSVDRALADIKKEEALLLDLLRLMRMHYDCIRQVHNFTSILNDATLRLTRAAGVAGKDFAGSGTRPGPFCYHSLRG
jgi:hypothetical protein